MKELKTKQKFGIFLSEYSGKNKSYLHLINNAILGVSPKNDLTIRIYVLLVSLNLGKILMLVNFR
jgi:hypothetical protein